MSMIVRYHEQTTNFALMVEIFKNFVYTIIQHHTFSYHYPEFTVKKIIQSLTLKWIKIPRIFWNLSCLLYEG